MIESRKWPPEFDKVVDMSKVNMPVISNWITKRITELLGFEDDIVIDYCRQQLIPQTEGSAGSSTNEKICPKKLQINLTGFLAKNSSAFVKDLWSLLLSAQETESGIPLQFLEEQKTELSVKQAEAQRIKEALEKIHRVATIIPPPATQCDPSTTIGESRRPPASVDRESSRERRSEANNRGQPRRTTHKSSERSLSRSVSSHSSRSGRHRSSSSRRLRVRRRRHSSSSVSRSPRHYRDDSRRRDFPERRTVPVHRRNYHLSNVSPSYRGGPNYNNKQSLYRGRHMSPPCSPSSSQRYWFQRYNNHYDGRRRPPPYRGGHQQDVSPSALRRGRAPASRRDIQRYSNPSRNRSVSPRPSRREKDRSASRSWRSPSPRRREVSSRSQSRSPSVSNGVARGASGPKNLSPRASRPCSAARLLRASKSVSRSPSVSSRSASTAKRRRQEDERKPDSSLSLSPRLQNASRHTRSSTPSASRSPGGRFNASLSPASDRSMRQGSSAISSKAPRPQTAPKASDPEAEPSLRHRSCSSTHQRSSSTSSFFSVASKQGKSRHDRSSLPMRNGRRKPDARSFSGTRSPSAASRLSSSSLKRHSSKNSRVSPRRKQSDVSMKDKHPPPYTRGRSSPRRNQRDRRSVSNGSHSSRSPSRAALDDRRDAHHDRLQSAKPEISRPLRASHSCERRRVRRRSSTMSRDEPRINHRRKEYRRHSRDDPLLSPSARRRPAPQNNQLDHPRSPSSLRNVRLVQRNGRQRLSSGHQGDSRHYDGGMPRRNFTRRPFSSSKSPVPRSSVSRSPKRRRKYGLSDREHDESFARRRSTARSPSVNNRNVTSVGKRFPHMQETHDRLQRPRPDDREHTSERYRRPIGLSPLSPKAPVVSSRALPEDAVMQPPASQRGADCNRGSRSPSRSTGPCDVGASPASIRALKEKASPSTKESGSSSMLVDRYAGRCYMDQVSPSKSQTVGGSRPAAKWLGSAGKSDDVVRRGRRASVGSTLQTGS